MDVVQDIFYIGWYYDMLKAGKTHELNDRWGGSQYNTGGKSMLPSYAYFAIPSCKLLLTSVSRCIRQIFIRI